MRSNELETCLADPWWRLTSGKLYKIMVKDDEADEGLVVPFIPNKSQLNLLKNFHNRNIILKARQLGFTTLIDLYFLDCALFRENVRAGIIAQNDDVAKTIFRDKIQFAYFNLPDELRAAMPLARDSQSELLFAHNNSSIRVSTSMRGGTLQYLHVSEFGKICAKFPDRAEEIITGSIPTVPSTGIVFIESTAEGQEGDFYEMTTRAEKLAHQDKKLNAKDYKFHFYAWWMEPDYRTNDDVIITEKDNEYFDKIEVLMGCEIDVEQRAWWCMTKDSEFSGQEEKMWQEYPSTPKEAFQKSQEGCYYVTQMTKARKEGRIGTVPYQPGVPVNTFWDIGSGDGTAVWCHQKVGQKDNFINFIEGWDEPYSYYVSKLQELDYVWGQHYLPHDGNHVRQDMNENLTPKEKLGKLGLKNIEIVERVSDISHGIQQVREVFCNYWFDETNCKEGIVHLDGYKKKYSKTNKSFTDIPDKSTGHSEAADALRQHAQGHKEEPGPMVKLKPMRGWGKR